MKKDNANETKSLKDYGIIYVSGLLDDGSSQNLCQEIIEMNVTGEVDHIQMIINSSGGSCTAGFAIIDMMEWSRIPVYTTGIGMIASMGLLVFMAGEKGRRVVTPRTSILSHRYSSMTMGNHSQLIAGRKEEDLMHERIIQHYLSYSGIRERDILESSLLRDVDTWLTPEEAIGYGIVDIVEDLKQSRLPVA